MISIALLAMGAPAAKAPVAAAGTQADVGPGRAAQVLDPGGSCSSRGRTSAEPSCSPWHTHPELCVRLVTLETWRA